MIRIQLLSVHIDKKQNRITSSLPCSFINLSVAHAFHVPLIITMCNNQNGFPYSGQLTESTRSAQPYHRTRVTAAAALSIYVRLIRLRVYVGQHHITPGSQQHSGRGGVKCEFVAWRSNNYFKNPPRRSLNSRD